MFVGDADRCYRAYDVATGDVLWETRLGHAGHGYPITYAVEGKQYIALPAGLGILRSATATLSPEIYSPESGNALCVFALPDQSLAIGSARVMEYSPSRSPRRSTHRSRSFRG